MDESLAPAAADLRGSEVSEEDRSVLDGKLAERRRHGLPDPMEDVRQLVEEGQGRRRSWIKPCHQEAEDQGSHKALLEGQGKEVAHYKVPKPAKRHQ